MGRDQSGEGAQCLTSGAGVVDQRGPGPSHVGVQRDDGVQGRVHLLDAPEVGIEEFPGGDLPGFEHRTLFHCAEVDD